MESKRKTLISVQQLYSEYMRIWSFAGFGVNITVKLVPYDYIAKEEHYLIANAANKFYKLVSPNDSKK